MVSSQSSEASASAECLLGQMVLSYRKQNPAEVKFNFHC